MRKRHSVQYTIRSLPKDLDLRLKKRAKQDGKSLNAVVLDALKRETGLGSEPRFYDDLDGLIGSWKEDPETAAALAEQDRIDEDVWK